MLGLATHLAVGLGLPQRLPVERDLLSVVLRPGHRVVRRGAGLRGGAGGVT